ncbi:hypothetical protein Sme01_62100 [Sphaerisporangium melleum]|uniref:Uncharacterized protein n=1 Tax=Sphaerisporangium melleum TaxID=321316 RepID=A0A917RB82_9ACTN|nr:hypothetical protein GCM10007964_45720 [Sphaerisporangium melleum]GII73734.1 hypothetical protein Sme01_62100 [Sphaerisporangium melleum]
METLLIKRTTRAVQRERAEAARYESLFRDREHWYGADQEAPGPCQKRAAG